MRLKAKYKGEYRELSITQWAFIVGIPAAILRDRKIDGWTDQQTIERPALYRSLTRLEIKKLNNNNPWREFVFAGKGQQEHYKTGGICN